MKKALMILLALMLALQGMAAFAEDPADAGATSAVVYDYDKLTVGTPTPMDGKFFTGMWGNATSDLDMRMLIHGYNLVEWDSAVGGFAIDPSVVSGIVVTENAEGDRTYTLTVYNDLYYSDGTQITARDYAFSMLLAMAPQIELIGGSLRPMNYLVGYDDYVNGQAPYLAGMRVIDGDTLAITVDNAYLPFFYELALLDCTPYPIHVIAPGCEVRDDGNGVYIANQDANVTENLFTAQLLEQTILDPETGYLSHPSVTSGPYRLLSFDGTTAELEINDYYKGNNHGQRPNIPHLTFTVVENDTAIAQLSQGEFGLLNKCVAADVLQAGTQLMASGDTFTFTNYARSGLSFVAFCCEKAPVDSVAVRQAIAHCLDKDSLVADVVRNYGLRVDGYYGLGQWMYQLIDGSQPFPVEVPAEDADQATVDAYDAQIEAWEALNLDDVTVYDFDTAAAAAMLDAEGWNLNRQGAPFDPATDDVRCKDVDGALTALELTMLCPEGSSLNDGLQEHFVKPLAEAGVLLTVEVKPMQELLRYYYRETARDYDMIALATNFDIVFDPSISFMPDGSLINNYNTTGINDETLYNLAVDMRRTSADDTLGYCRKWIAFEQRFQELTPMLPIYSNVYFDFYPRVLHDYDVSSNVSWGQAIVGAYLSDVSDEELAAGGMVESEDIEIIG